MSVLDNLQTRAAASPARIVLSEGHDPPPFLRLPLGSQRSSLLAQPTKSPNNCQMQEAHQAMPSALKTPPHPL